MRYSMHPQGGGAIWNSGTIEMHTSTLAANNADQQGGAVSSAGTMVMHTCRLTANTSPQGATLFLTVGSTTTYVLPAPPGYWVPATTCEVWRKACDTGDTSCDQAREKCSMQPGHGGECSMNATAGAETHSVCQPILFVQPCDWQANPALLGKTAFVLPLGISNDDLPYACAPGVLRGTKLLDQTSSICAGMCTVPGPKVGDCLQQSGQPKR